PMLGHEIDLLGRRELRRNDQVAFVLPVLGVDQDVHAAIACLLDDLLNRRDRVGKVVLGHVGFHSFAFGRHSSMRATYRASMSTSRLTRSPRVRAPRVVTLSV